jgi:hypothetical protein
MLSATVEYNENTHTHTHTHSKQEQKMLGLTVFSGHVEILENDPRSKSTW